MLLNRRDARGNGPKVVQDAEGVVPRKEGRKYKAAVICDNLDRVGDELNRGLLVDGNNVRDPDLYRFRIAEEIACKPYMVRKYVQATLKENQLLLL